MDDMVLVSKVDSLAGSGSLRLGRPKRTNFCLRRNDKLYMLGIPSGTYEEGDRINFFLSPTGFAVNFTPSGERTISGKLTNRTAMIPRVIADHMTGTKNGVTELVSEEHPNRTWFFPFSQFPPLQAAGNLLPVDHPTTLMEK
jgi:hypothetical protein